MLKKKPLTSSELRELRCYDTAQHNAATVWNNHGYAMFQPGELTRLKRRQNEARAKRDQQTISDAGLDDA